MKNTAMKKLAVVAALSCACAVAWAENVLYIHPLNYDSTQGANAFCTYNYAFADKISTSVSIAIWAKDVSATYEKFLAGVSDRWNLARMHTSSAETNGKLAFRTESGNVLTSGAVLTDHNWHFIVGTFNYDSANAGNSFQRLYVDGTLAAEKTDGITAITTPDKMFTLGGAATDMTSHGSISWTQGLYAHFAELSVWNRALSSSEVSALYSRTSRLAGNESGLVAYWPLTGTPGMAAADYTSPNCAATAGVPNLISYYTNYGYTDRVDIVDDDDFSKPYVRFVASPEWCAANTYEQAADATGRSWADPLTNLVETAATVKKFERILCSPGTHKIASTISPLVTYFYLGSQDPATGEPCPETAIIDAQELCRHFTSNDQNSGHQSGFTVENLTFVNGSADNGGSMYFRSKTGKINNCIFHGNKATTGQGGAFYSYLASGTVVSNCVFRGNQANGSGGGAVYTQQGSESATDFQRFVGCVFTNNSVQIRNTGGSVWAGRKIELEDCLFSDNQVAGGTGGHAAVGANSIIKGCVFTGECKANYGACLSVGASTVVSNCVFRNVTSSGGYDFIRSKTGGTFVDCVITNNISKAPLFRPDSNRNLLIRQCLIAGNSSDKAVVDDQSSSAMFENCTILQPIFDLTSAGSCTNILVNCILPNATITSSGNFCNILSNCLVKVAQNGPYDSGVITGSAGFKDAAHGDYTLKPGSQCREKGLTLGWMTEGSTDLLGNPRVVDRDGNAFTAAALPDLGCYEIQERLPGFMVIVF